MAGCHLKGKSEFLEVWAKCLGEIQNCSTLRTSLSFKYWYYLGEYINKDNLSFSLTGSGNINKFTGDLFTIVGWLVLSCLVLCKYFFLFWSGKHCVVILKYWKTLFSFPLVSFNWSSNHLSWTYINHVSGHLSHLSHISCFKNCIHVA